MGIERDVLEERTSVGASPSLHKLIKCQPQVLAGHPPWKRDSWREIIQIKSFEIDDVLIGVDLRQREFLIFLVALSDEVLRPIMGAETMNLGHYQSLYYSVE